MPPKDYYVVLGVPKQSDIITIRQAFRELAIQWHPNHNPKNKKAARAKFIEVCEAYFVLSGQRTRRQYDEFGFNQVSANFWKGYSGFGGYDFNYLHRTYKFEYAVQNFRQLMAEEDPVVGNNTLEVNLQNERIDESFTNDYGILEVQNAQEDYQEVKFKKMKNEQVTIDQRQGYEEVKIQEAKDL